MAQATHPIRRGSFHGRGLFQLGLIGTAFSAIRLLQSPSTLTFFVFEIIAAATAGIYLSARGTDVRGLVHSPTPKTDSSEADRIDPSPLTRLRSLAVRLGADSSGSFEEVRNAVKTAVMRPESISSAARTLGLGPNVIDRIAPTTQGREHAHLPSGPDAYLSQLAKEGRALVDLARDLGLPATSFGRSLRRAGEASRIDRVKTAIALLERGNRRLRARLGHQVEHDLNVSQNSDRAYLSSSTLFFVLIAMALWALSSGLYVAPAAFYVLIALATGVAAVNVQFSGNRRPVGNLAQIVVLAVLLKFYFFFLNPYLYSSDTFFHFLGLQGIASTGHVPDSLGHYTFFPAYHVYAFAGVSVAGLPLTWYGLFGLVAQLAAIPVAYLAGREIANPRVGLFAALFTALSVFFFLWVIPLPSLFGFAFLFIALYALFRIQKPGSWAWVAVFWTAALGALFSHPITALVLLLTLLLRFTYFSVESLRTSRPRTSTIPALSYCVVYAGYLAFLASVSFETFARAMFAATEESQAALATKPQEVLQATSAFLLQSAIAPASIAILFFFAAYGMIASRGIASKERRFLILIGVAFVVIPGVEVALQSFRGQSSRFLSYLVIPLALIGAHGVARANVSIHGRRRVAGVIFVVFAVTAFVGASSYLTNNDVRYLYSEIPAIPTHISDSTLASRDFVALANKESWIYLDFGSWIYIDNSARARNPLYSLHTRWLEEFSGDRRAFVMVNNEFLAYGNPYLGSVYNLSTLIAHVQDAGGSRVFDAGGIQVYLIP